jgi:hypothetical protein
VEETIRRHFEIRGGALPALNVRTNHVHVVVIRTLIEAAREQTARAVNSTLVGLYWQIGKRIREDALGHKRPEYCQQIVSALSTQLTFEYGRGYTEKSLRHMIRFAEAFPDEVIVSALRRELSWTHFSSSENVMEMSVDDSASCQWPTQRRFEPTPCPGTSAANSLLRHREASSIAAPPA